MKKNQKGITLIALVITIILLIIVAGITLNLVFGKDGIIQKAENAKIQQEIAYYKEQIELIRASELLDFTNLGKVTIDRLIEAIYENGLVPRGNITKTNETTAKMITKEGYVFEITADGVNYLGKEDELEEPPEPITGKIVFEKVQWLGIDNAKIEMKRSGTAGSKLNIQYQINTQEENGWKVATSVENLKHNDIVYARIWNGKEAGDIVTYKVQDKIAPKIKNQTYIQGIYETNYNTIIPSNDSIQIQLELEDLETGINNRKIEYAFKKENDYDYQYQAIELPESNIIQMNTPQEGGQTYYLSIKFFDNAGNFTYDELYFEVREKVILADVAKENDIIKYMPESKDFTITSAMSGYETDQSYNTKETMQNDEWAVLYSDAEYGLQIMKATARLKLKGRIGYNNIIDTLNKVSSYYANEKYTISARALGTNPKNPIDTDTWDERRGCKIPSGSFNDYQDVKQIKKYPGSSSDNNMQKVYEYSYWAMRKREREDVCVITYGQGGEEWIYVHDYSNDQIDGPYSDTRTVEHAVAPVLTFKKDLKGIVVDVKRDSDENEIYKTYIIL